jgi:hypothetical protein
MVTANGEKVVRVFELFVCVLDKDGKQLVDKNDPVYPHAPYYLGSMCPVAEIEGEVQYDEQGRQICLRLSGMLPFAACYVASAPTRDGIHLGEDRNDVLGSHKMPGQKKWSLEEPTLPSEDLPDDHYGRPKITFSHRQGMIVDRDYEDIIHASVVTILEGTRKKTVLNSNPRQQRMEQERLKKIDKDIISDPDLHAELVNKGYSGLFQGLNF